MLPHQVVIERPSFGVSVQRLARIADALVVGDEGLQRIRAARRSVVAKPGQPAAVDRANGAPASGLWNTIQRAYWD